jgi:dihydrofolate synthase/folylpolyglutamate synthase
MNLIEWLDHQLRQHPREIELGLDRVRSVAQRLQSDVVDPLLPAPWVITVAGTNGKGSTVAFIEAIARAAGWRVGAYTSPHLFRYNERVRVDGREVDDAILVDAFERIEAARRGDGVGAEIPLTYFEFGTLAALLVFAESALDLAILEVGLGGRLDAVNIVDADVAVITTVDLDHRDWLGTDRETIGVEKAGILREGRPAILAEADPPASVLRHAYRIGAIAIRAGCDYFVEAVAADPFSIRAGEQGWVWREPGYAIALPMPALRAPSQLANAGAAIAALRALTPTASLPELSDAAIAAGVRNATLPARLQRIVLPTTGGADADIVVDVGHNPQAARELAAWLATHPPSGATDALFSGLADKDLAAVVEPLLPFVRRWHLCGLATETPRGLAADDLLHRLASALADADVELHADVPAALQAARATLRAGDRLLAFGSFYTAAAVLRALDASATQ